MLKAKGKVVSLLTACLTAVLALVLGFASLFAPTPITTADAANTEIVFELGANGAASHNDGSSKTEYTETVDGYMLNITGGTSMYTGARDLKGNGCIKLGTSSKTGGFSFTVPADVTSVVIAIGKYKANASKVTVNGTAYTLSGSSNDGAYDAITVDTSSTKTVKLTTVSGGVRAMVNTITYVIAGSGSDCEHTNTVYTYENGMHTLICANEECKEVREEATACTINNPTYSRKGDQHTKSGTCSVCNNEVEIIEDCSLSYSHTPNDDKTHNTTSICSVCNKSVVTENVACTFGAGVVNGTVATYTCEYCEYSYTEEVATWTVSFSVPDGIEAVESKVAVQGEDITLPTADTIEGYSFVGWVEATLDEKTEAAPEYFAAGEEYTPTADFTLYALYSYAEGTGAWTKVTKTDNLAVGKKIVIVASDSDYALGPQSSNNRTAVAIKKDGDALEVDDNVQIITLEAGTVDGTFAFNVGNSYLYAASSSSNHLKTQATNDANGSWKIEISTSGVATIKAQGTNTRNWLRKNSTSALFSCYASGQNDVSIYMKDGATYYVTTLNTCAHEDTYTETDKEATCDYAGSENVICSACEALVKVNEIPALGHDFTSNECPRCGLWNDYSGYYTIAFTQGESLLYANATDWKSDKYSADANVDTSCVDIQYLFRLTKQDDGSYELTEANGKDNITAMVTLERIVDGENEYFTLKNKEGYYLGLNHSSTYDYVKFYSSSNYPHNITLTYVALDISSASLSLGESLAMNYYVKTTANLDDAVMFFDFNEVTYDVKGVKQADGRYMFTLDEIAPQYMTDNISATLKLDETTLASKTEYSIQAYAQNTLNNNPSDELKQLLTAMLDYGEAAQKHEGYKLDDLAANGTADFSDVEIAKEDNEISLEDNPDIDTYPAWFVSANIWFSSVNKIRVTLSTAENVTLKINDVEVPVNGTTVYTDGIKATEFGNKVKFELYHNGTLMQTLYYSVYSYAYSMQDSAKMGDLVKALYRYGEAAVAYASANA